MPLYRFTDTDMIEEVIWYELRQSSNSLVMDVLLHDNDVIAIHVSHSGPASVISFLRD